MRQRIDAAMLVEAPVLIGEQHLDEARIDVVDVSPAAASGPPAWHRRATAGRRDRAPASTASTSAERRRPGRATARHHAHSRSHRGDKCAAAADDAARMMRPSRHRITCRARPPWRRSPVRPKRSGRYMSSTSACGSTYRPGRHRAHHVGDPEHRRVLGSALERRAEAVVAEFRVRRLVGVLDPGQRAGLARRDQPRIVDLETGRQIIGDQHAAELRLVSVIFSTTDEALVLLGLGRIGRLAVERVIVALDLEALSAAGSGASARRRPTPPPARRLAGVGHPQRLAASSLALDAAIERAFVAVAADIERHAPASFAIARAASSSQAFSCVEVRARAPSPPRSRAPRCGRPRARRLRWRASPARRRRAARAVIDAADSSRRGRRLERRARPCRPARRGCGRRACRAPRRSAPWRSAARSSSLASAR